MKYCPYCMNELTDDITICPKCGKNTAEYQHPAHVLKQGAVLNNRYLIGGLIGEGGFGITYIGMDTLLQYRVAIKEFFPNGMVNRNNTVSNEVLSISTDTAKELFSKSRENFLREARTLAKFSNESGIVAVKDFFEENHTVYIVMEYLDGITLKEYLKQVGTISPYNTVCLLMPVFNSLKKVHEKKLIHRDISPDNIMLVGEEVKLLDFGAAREFADEKSLSVMLKHGYAPMEQYRRHGIQGAWTDVYAICATMYKCITGQIPPDAPDRVFEDELKMPSEFGIEIDPAFEKVLRHGLAVKPDERIQSIDELLEELDAVPGIDIGSNSGASSAQHTVTPQAKTTAAQAVSSPKQEDDIRLSEYVPHYAEDAEAKPKPAPEPAKKEEAAAAQYDKPAPVPPSPAVSQPKPAVNVPPQPPEEKKPKKNKALFIGAVAAGVVVVCVATGIVIAMGSNQPVQQTSDISSPASSSASEVSSPSSIDKQSSTEESKAPVQSSVESKVESSVVSEVSKPESSAEPSEAEPSKTSEPSEEPSAQSSDESSGESSGTLLNITFPDLKDYFKLENGMLRMDYSLFGKDYDTIVDMFRSGTLYMSESHPIYGSQYTILYVPIKTAKHTSEYVDSVDLFFLDDKLVSVEFENEVPFNDDIAKYARQCFGEPTHNEKDDILWMFKSSDVSFTLFMKEYPATSTSPAELYFTQKYFTSAAAVG